MADLERPFRASHLLSDPPPEEIFAALLDVRELDITSRAEVFEVRPGTLLEFTLSGGWLIEEAGTVRMTLSTDYEIRPRWLNRIVHRPFFRRATEDLLRRSIRRFGEYLRTG